MRTHEVWITNAKLILPEEIIEGHVHIRQGKIAAIVTGEMNEVECTSYVQVIDAAGLHLMPGIIETHSDAIEKEIQPRPNSVFPLEMAMHELEKKMAAVGITTLYHSICSSDGTPVRNDRMVADIIEFAARRRQEPSMLRHRVHLRYEVTNVAGIPMVQEMLELGQVDLLSFMDHTPGQGQYKTRETLRDYLIGTEHMSTEEAEATVDQLIACQQQVDWEKLKDLIQLAKEKRVQLASHDDDTADKVQFMRELGIWISEFPVSLDAAKAAKAQGMYVSVGAPNIVRGASHNKNLRAMDAIEAGAVDILCSDYHPPSLLPAVSKISDTAVGLAQAVRMVTLNPAQALGIDQEFGSIEVGKVADLVLVEMRNGYPLVRKTLIAGKFVYQSDYFQVQGEELR
ncbi:phosphonate metabolism protein PhnM [Paenibacillus sp. SYP-B3998]|uniref:Phosphonate metabolism protein PhnM n=1 Tax=Paenibacillus sp. SYP-B3998 TaxID=2678564 RepID=A0A6G4A2S7_9BACL|nr:phosphonate metabolism protein PhnM [Paenibacillus sp. SYP-B3998]NEW08119.1 phosphonate metabolism protein PhnM [Paenibacillus sp. SYP-B3998]